MDYSGDVYTHENGSWFRHVLDVDFGRRFPVPVSEVCVGSVHPFANGLNLDELMREGEMDISSKVMKGFVPELKMGFIPVFVDGERVFYGSPIMGVQGQLKY